MQQMKAVVYYGAGDVRVEDAPVPSAGDGELRVEVDACAVCGTDYKAYKSGNPRIEPPRILGHEFTGLVETVGEGAEGFSTGDRVVMATSVSCGECFYCEKGHPNLCLDVRPMGYYYQGGMARYTVIPPRAVRNGHVIKMHADVSPEHAALAEPVSCAVNAAENAGIRQGDTVVVLGAGPMGIINACVAKQFGAEKIIISEINDLRLESARRFGFDRCVGPDENLQEVVAEETGGLGADVALVAAPAAAPQEQAVQLVRKRGCVCLFASLPSGKSLLSVDSRPIHYREIKVVGTSDSAPDHVHKAVSFITSGALPLEQLATHVLPLEEIFHAYELMQTGEGLRVVLKP